MANDAGGAGGGRVGSAGKASATPILGAGFCTVLGKSAPRAKRSPTSEPKSSNDGLNQLLNLKAKFKYIFTIPCLAARLRARKRRLEICNGTGIDGGGAGWTGGVRPCSTSFWYNLDSPLLQTQGSSVQISFRFDVVTGSQLQPTTIPLAPSTSLTLPAQQGSITAFPNAGSLTAGMELEGVLYDFGAASAPVQASQLGYQYLMAGWTGRTMQARRLRSVWTKCEIRCELYYDGAGFGECERSGVYGCCYGY
ncbi:hypothetical protein BDK51DRAFT_40154, partial [Blyttiomyces helicus]